MRLCWLVGLLLAHAAPAHATDEDDPKLMRDTPAVSTVLPDEDDPKLSRGALRRGRLWPITHPVPRLKVGYRRLTLPSPDGSALPFDLASVEAYPLSNYVRLGIGAEAGYSGSASSVWYATLGVSLGLQWPARVTPFVEGRFAAGLLGGAYLGDPLFGWTYVGGVDAGAEIYYLRRFYISVALGWAHPSYQAIQASYARTHGDVMRGFSGDSFTFRIGLGL
jgi:hypothetical protein